MYFTKSNVFFIIEVVRALAEEAGGLDGVGTRELPLRVVAGGVSAIVRRRLQRVPDWARPLLQAAAVAGRHVDLAVLQAIEPRLDGWLQVCLDAAVLEVNDAQWRFSHDKLREALLAALSAEQRRRLHRQIGETLELIYGESGAHEVALAFHFEQAGDLRKAARLTAQAGTGALRRGALHEAAALLKRAETLEEQVGAPLLSRTATMRRLLRAYYGIDRRKECEELCRKAMGLLGRSIPDTRAGRLRALLQQSAVELRNRIFGARVTQDASERALAKELLSLLKSTGDTFFDSGDVALLIMLFSLHAAEQLGDAESQANYLSWLGYTAYILPLHGLGKLYLERAAELLRQNPQFALRSDYHTFIGYTHYAEGNLEQSAQAFTAWISRMGEARYAGLLGLAYSTRSMTYLTSARWEEALADGERCLEIARSVANSNYTALGLCCRALVLLPRGQVAEAYAVTREAQPHIDRLRSRGIKVSLTGVSTLAALQAGERGLALELLNRVVALMARTVPPAPTLFMGYSAALEVALRFFLAPQSSSEHAGSGERLRTVLYHLLRFAHRFPVARPRVLTAIARILEARGQTSLATATLRLGLSSATRLCLPYEQALCHFWLGRTVLAQASGTESRSRARLHLTTAEKLFSASGYAIDLLEVRKVLSTL